MALYANGSLSAPQTDLGTIPTLCSIGYQSTQRCHALRVCIQSSCAPPVTPGRARVRRVPSSTPRFRYMNAYRKCYADESSYLRTVGTPHRKRTCQLRWLKRHRPAVTTRCWSLGTHSVTIPCYDLTLFRAGGL